MPVLSHWQLCYRTSDTWKREIKAGNEVNNNKQTKRRQSYVQPEQHATPNAAMVQLIFTIGRSLPPESQEAKCDVVRKAAEEEALLQLFTCKLSKLSKLAGKCKTMTDD